jgi:hypothetical protein
MLEAAAPPERRDRELRRRLAKTETEQALALERLAQVGVDPDEANGGVGD